MDALSSRQLPLLRRRMLKLRSEVFRLAAAPPLRQPPQLPRKAAAMPLQAISSGTALVQLGGRAGRDIGGALLRLVAGATLVLVLLGKLQQSTGLCVPHPPARAPILTGLVPSLSAVRPQSPRSAGSGLVLWL